MLRSIGYFFVAALLCTVLLELFVRGAEISAVSETDYQEEIGRIIRPNAKIVHYNENFTYSQMNKYGYRGPAYPPVKDSGTLRIALLGDSYVEGFQVLDRHHFRTVLEEELKNAYQYDNIEILNFGRSGFGLEDTYAYDKNFVSKFNPDLKVYVLGALDFYENSQDKLLPKWKLVEGQLQQDTSYRTSQELKVYSLAKLGLQNSAILQMLRNGINVIKDGRAGEVMLGKLYQRFHQKEIHKSPETKVQEALPEVANAILAELDIQNNVIIVNKDSVSYPLHLEQSLSQNNIVSIHLADTLTTLKDQLGIDPRYWPVTNTKGHWNYAAHKAVGEYLSKALREKVYFPRASLGFKSRIQQ
ncbi:hypothetical protein PZB74_06235 [Porifericola rhodea]|uniref:hypothetical protein n=1 Tax=Porifericola rhodea TaxID=930972 RepID=UPI0026655A79|nr:hypothetical protein [Porifericola rhodea]WKN32941.1 hypothetical protein PZB74_06235 [Porifericola rhodea]